MRLPWGVILAPLVWSAVAAGLREADERSRIATTRGCVERVGFGGGGSFTGPSSGIGSDSARCFACAETNSRHC